MADAEDSGLSVSLSGVSRIPEPWLRIERYSLQVSVAGLTRQLDRVVCGRGDRVAVLPYCPERGTVLLVRVLRIGPFLAHPESPLLIEVPGGLIEDAPLMTAAAAEARQETGCQVTALERIASVYLAPQLSTEQTHLFLGEYHERPPARTQLDSEGEVGQLLELPLRQALQTATEAGVVDAKTMLLLQAGRARWPEPGAAPH